MSKKIEVQKSAVPLNTASDGQESTGFLPIGERVQIDGDHNFLFWNAWTQDCTSTLPHLDLGTQREKMHI